MLEYPLSGKTTASCLLKHKEGFKVHFICQDAGRVGIGRLRRLQVRETRKI